MRANSLFRRLTALTLCAALSLPAAYAHAGYQRLRTDRALADGLTYSNVITQDAAGREEAFVLTLESREDVYPITIQSAGTVYGKATMARALAEAEALGYNVLAAINSDYFSFSTGVPMGMAVENGVYKSSPGDFPAVAFVDGQTRLVENPRVGITLLNHTTGQQLALTNFNKWRTPTGGIYLLNRDFSSVSTRASGQGWMVRMQVLEGEMTVAGQMTLTVTECFYADGEVAIGEKDYILTAAAASGLGEVFERFQPGDEITLTTHCQDENLLNARWVTGTGDLIVKNGTLTDSSAWQHSKEGRAPRTALGVRGDGTAVFYVVDGRQGGYSTGLTQQELADEMIRRGCVWAVNLDGGGSSTLAVKTPGNISPVVVNRPSDGVNRACATYVLLVTDQQGGDRPRTLALKEDGLVVLAGSSVTLGEVIALDSGANPSGRDPGQVEFDSLDRLGTLEGAVYTAGPTVGTDTIDLYSPQLDIEGTAQIHVVDTLTALTVTETGKTAALTAVSLSPGEELSLSVQGSYWGRTALRGVEGVQWAVTDGGGTVTPEGLYTAGDRGATLTVTAGGLTATVTVTMQGIHNDVTQERWSYAAVRYCYEQGIVGGVSPTEFGPTLNIRRGDFALMLYRAAGQPQITVGTAFTDVAPTDYYADAISWAVEQSVASGLGDGTFGAQAPITREQALTMLRRALPQLGQSAPDAGAEWLGQFADRDAIADYARDHIAALAARGLISGAGGAVNPKGSLTREEMAALLYKIATLGPAPTQPPPAVDTQPQPQPQPQPLPQPDTPSQPQQPDAVGRGVVTGAVGGLNVRSGPGRDQAVLGQLPDAAAVAVLEVREGWYRVTGNGLTGYVSADYLNFTPYGTVTGAASGLNLRQGPGTDFEILARLADGSRVAVLETLEGWYRVEAQTESGVLTGYVAASYITFSQGGT